jgi:hypothetical protein
MPEEIDLLKLICQRLENDNFSYMLTGSMAANFYTVPRMTRDIDIVIELVEPDVKKFLHVFEKDFYINENSISDAIIHDNMFNIIHNETVFKADFVIRKPSLYRRIEFQRRRRIELDGMPIWIVAPEDLIISKLLWSKDSMSDLQLKDVKNLLTSLKNLDLDYVDKWVDALEIYAGYEKAKHG